MNKSQSRKKYVIPQQHVYSKNSKITYSMLVTLNINGLEEHPDNKFFKKDLKLCSKKLKENMNIF